jgi:hypothetical protein
MTEDPTVEQPLLTGPPSTSPPPSGSPPGLPSETPVYSTIRAFSFFLMMIGFILLFLAWNDCGSMFGGFPNHFYEFCGGGCFLIILGSLIWAQTDHVEDKAKLEKMNDEQKELEIAKKKKEEREWGIVLLIMMLTLIFALFFTCGGFLI